MNTHWKRWIVLGLMTASFGIIASNANDVQVQSYIVHADSYQIPYKGKEKEFHHKINLGYGSALVFKDMKRDGTIEFYGITDRRPNGDIPTYLKDGQKKSGKFFPTPEFTPSIGVITVSPTKKRTDITQSIPLNVQGKPITGKPLPDGLTGSTNELAFKKADGEQGYNARKAILYLEKLRLQGNLLTSVSLPNGGTLRVEPNCVDVSLPEDLPDDKADNRILKVCKSLEASSPVLVTKDLVLRLKAQMMSIEAQDFSTEQVIPEEEQYTGRIQCYASEEAFDHFLEDGLDAETIYQWDELGHTPPSPTIRKSIRADTS